MRNLYLGDRGILVSYLQLALNRARQEQEQERAGRERTGQQRTGQQPAQEGRDLVIDGRFGELTCRAYQVFMGEDQTCTVDDAGWRRLMPYLRGYRINSMGDSEIFSFPLVSDQVSYTSLLNEAVVEGLKVRYPFLETGSIGNTVMGKRIPYIAIGNGNTQVFYNASFHANENITTPVLLKFAEEYASAYANEGELYGIPARELFETYQLFLVPMVNPDGVDLVNGFLVNGSYYRQAGQIAEQYPQIPFPAGWKANIEGIDLNLQFPAGWENARAIKAAQGYTSPAPRDYVGEAPLTAPESVAVYEFTRNHNFSLILAYHTQGRVIYWRYLDYEPVNSYEIAQYFGEVSGYAVEETPTESGYAGYKDWFIQEYDRPGYTIEAGEGENPLPMTQFPQIYQENSGILLGGMTQTG